MALFASGGCGGPSDEDEIRAIVRSYLHALSERDYETACTHLSERVKADMAKFAEENLPELESPDCPRLIEHFLARADQEELRESLREAEEKEIEVEIDGDRATIAIEGATNPPRLRKLDGVWRISQLRVSPG